MNHLQKLIRQIAWRIFAVTLAGCVLTAIAWELSKSYFSQPAISGAIVFSFVLALSLVLARYCAKTIVEPVQVLWQAILHVSQSTANVPAPNLEQVKIGHDLVGSLSLQVYQLASSMNEINQTGLPLLGAKIENALIRNMPIPIIALDKNLSVVFVSHTAQQYCGLPDGSTGQNIYAILDLSFPNENTFEQWLNTVKNNKVSDTHAWERVRLRLPDQKTIKQFDMAASYSKDDPSGTEILITMFDRTRQYGQDDRALSFIALAVHELRTPLTVLRGYIEVFEEEFAGKLTPELADFMQKMHASSESLAGFVNNILNVARIEDNQMVLRLNEENWSDLLSSAINDMRLRAQVHNKTIELVIAPNLPTIAVDRVSIYEVLNNLIDNAIKYSGNEPKKIIVKSGLNNEGLIETTVQDFGVGIPESLTANLFEKFYRSHRSRAQIGGTGLGLYLSKAIVSSHGGNIWVRSKEGEGAIFGFTLVPFAQLADEMKNTDNKEITRNAYGWIKNHSLYRR